MKRSGPLRVAPPPGLRLGPIAIDAHLGRGGMGHVYRGRDVAHQTPLAIKVLARRVHDAGAIQRFYDEVRAVARLDHEHVVRIFDVGQLDPALGAALLALAPPDGPASRRSTELDPRSLVPDAPSLASPYLVMELCRGRVLDAAEQLSWPRLARTLGAILSALAHAHARGVVHRDLKPSNVLAGDDPTSELKLIDFGLAWLAEGSGERFEGHEVSGTPRYMAPEQFLGRLREVGPWTDLYALGCVAFELCTGRPPFRGTTLAEVAAAHLGVPPPPMLPRAPAPVGLEGWIRTLLEKSPDRRFRSAADAAFALSSLRDDAPSELWPGRGDVSPPIRPGESERPGDSLDAPTRTDDVSSSALRLTALGASARPPAPDVARAAPPIPPTSVAVAPATVLAGTDEALFAGAAGLGLGIYALRSASLVGREAERAALWEALRGVHLDGQPRAVLLEGPTGVGKSRLAGWLCERAHELGSAVVIRATHAAGGPSEGGVAAALVRHLHAVGLGHAEMAQRVRRASRDRLSEHEARVLADVMAPAAAVEVAGAPQTEVSERFEALRRFLVHLAEERPVLLWLDDAGYAPEALQLVSHVLGSDAEPSARVLFVVTLRDEPRGTSEREAGAAAADGVRAVVDRLRARADVASIDVAPLPPADHARLIRRLLPLSAEVSSHLEVRTAGNPMFAIVLVGDWVERGLLAPSDTGFRVREGASLSMPDDLAQAWEVRIDRILEHEPAEVRRAAELAAACGHVVARSELLLSCAAVGVSEDALERLFRAGLVQPLTGDGAEDEVTFEHAMIREVVQRRAQAEGRWAEHARTLAAVLAGRPRAVDVDERRGRFLLAGERPEEAAALLYDAAAERRRRGELSRTQELVALGRAALAQAGVAEDDPRWGDLAALRASALGRAGAIAAADEAATAAIADARRFGWPRALAEALWARASAIGQGGRHVAARIDLEEARALFAAFGDSAGEMRVLRGLAHLARITGRLEDAEELLASCLARARQADAREHIGWTLQGMATLRAAQGDLAAAADLARQATREMERADCAYGAAHSLNTVAEIARRRGDFTAAEESYARALELASSLGSMLRHIVRLNLGLLLVDRGRHDEGEAQLARCLRAATDVRIGVLDYGARAGLVFCAAEKAAWPAFDEHASALAQVSQSVVEREAAGWALRAVESARARGEVARADALLETAKRLRGDVAPPPAQSTST